MFRTVWPRLWRSSARNCISSGLALKPWSKRQAVDPPSSRRGPAPGTVKEVFIPFREPMKLTAQFSVCEKKLAACDDDQRTHKPSQQGQTGDLCRPDLRVSRPRATSVRPGQTRASTHRGPPPPRRSAPRLEAARLPGPHLFDTYSRKPPVGGGGFLRSTGCQWKPAVCLNRCK